MAKGYLKLTILKILANGPQNGYGLMKGLEKTLGKKPSPGSVYPILKDLLDKKIVSLREDGKRKDYTITQHGRESVRQLTKRKEEFINQMKSSMKMYETICGPKEARDAMEMMDRMKKTDVPFGNLTDDLIEMKSTLLKITKKRLQKQKEEKLLRIIKETNSKLKKFI